MPATILIPINPSKTNQTAQGGSPSQPKPKAARASLLDPALRIARSA
ncbi:MAG: hypothetical protein ACFCUR_08650 [Rhodomicrobiaceae bacterium]